MPNYKAMYFQLAAKVADVVDLLIEAQKQGEENYISGTDIPITLENSNTSQIRNAKEQ